ncbi:Hypothetical predicted protein [Mytilus galloprovincialis]|uniref:Uncharacterized protein n=1 Tax=Mytilus galloprovincialis TaxID=29158 RepID=A0A8B6CDG6_MYTGA|nr:Hypothetical predicted protein [Mytilus galloprovincialis]
MTDKAFKLLRKPVIKYSAVPTSVYVFLTILTVTFAEILHTRGGGGRLVEPPGRSSLWRSNSTLQPVNENDHRNNCGGFEKQWLKNKGKCGICGDPFDGPRDHENGEKYDHKFISRTFKHNEIINVTVEITKNLSGYIEFRICDNSNDNVITVDCLDRNVLEIGDTKYKKYKVWNSGYHVIPIQLPNNLTCDKCLLQFRYHTGYRWGCDGDDCCYGCGPMQEEFYSCADIRILPDQTLKFKTRRIKSQEYSQYMAWWCRSQCSEEECDSSICPKQANLRLKRQTTKICKGTGLWTDNRGMDFWCRINCDNPIPYCPPEYCECDTGDVETTTTTTPAPTTTPGRLFAYINPIQSTATYGDVLVQIQCFVTGIPVADTWYWTRKPLNGGPITTIGKGTDSADYIVDNSPTSPSLTILGITKVDEADYTCYATNAAGTSSSSSSRLYVNGDLLAISIEPESFTIVAGDSSYKILCIISGSPQATSWYWTKSSLDGNSISTIGQGTNNQKYTVDNSPNYPHLTIKDITENDEGDYECHATNAAGQSTSNRKSRLLVTVDTVTNIVRVLASAGCQYCNKKDNVTCSNWYCSEGLPNRRMVSLSIQARCNALPPVIYNLAQEDLPPVKYNRGQIVKFLVGLMDAEAMVTQAASGRMFRHNKHAQHQHSLDPGSTSGSSYTTDIRSISASDCSSITYLEHVTIDISFSYTEYRGASEFYLVSPSGTESHLMHYRYDDAIYYASAGSLSWTFMSVHFWRESPIGQWALKFKSYRGFSVVTVNSWSITFTELPQILFLVS